MTKDEYETDLWPDEEDDEWGEEGEDWGEDG